MDISTKANSFSANGTKYLIFGGSMSVFRYEMFEKLNLEIGFGSDFETMFGAISKAYGLINQMKVADAAVVLHDVLRGIARNMDEREHPMLLLCTLFICKEGENMATWSETEATEKIKDWKAEGISMDFFLNLAKNSVPGFLQALQIVSPDTSEATETPTTNGKESE